MKIWRNPLPMNGRLSLLKNFWSKNITKVIDTLHIHNHQVQIIFITPNIVFNLFVYYIFVYNIFLKAVYNTFVYHIFVYNIFLKAVYNIFVYNIFLKAKCKELYNPKKLKDVYPSGNTVICEETFAWLGR